MFLFSGEKVIEDESDSRILVIFISLAAVVTLIFLGILVGVCWWIDRRKTKRLTKDRVDISYKYEPISRTNTPSIITDPKVNNDLEGNVEPVHTGSTDSVHTW